MIVHNALFPFLWPFTSPSIAGLAHVMDGSQVRVADWYAGKCVLVTGATGFVGKVVAEALLRKVPNISAILLLVRPNAKATPTQRFTELLASSIFDTLREQLGAEAFERLARTKMHPIAGDLILPRLGMSDEDWTRLTSSVQVVLMPLLFCSTSRWRPR